MRSFFKYKFICLSVFLIFVFVPAKINAQSLSYTLSQAQQCYTSGTNTLSAQIISSPPTTASYTWNVQGPSCSPTYTNAALNGSIINISSPCCGIYTLTALALSSTSSVLATYTGTYIITCPPPVSISGSSAVCAGATGIITANGANSYTWSTGSSSITISVTPSTTTNYSVIGTVGTCTNTAVQTVSVYTVPSVGIIANNSTVCPGQTTILTATGAVSYNWINGPPTFSYAVTPYTSTSYTVIGSIGICSNTAVQSILVSVPPTISVIASPSVVCSGHTATLVAAGANTYTWSGGTISPTVVVSPLTTTVYTVTGTNSLGCYSSAVQIVLLNPTPVLTISPGNPTICAGSSLNLVSTGAQSYTWNIGATNSLVSISPTTTAFYIVNGSNSSGCVGIDSVTVAVIPTVIASFTFTNLANGLVSFSNTSSNTTSTTNYSWTFGNGLTSNSISPSTTYTANGIYTITLVASSSCGSSSITQTLSINNIAGPVCAANFTYVSVSPGNYSFVSTSSGTASSTTYSWNFGNGTPIYVATASAGIHPPAQTYTNGTFLVILYIVNSSPVCTNSFALVLNVCALSANFTHTQPLGNTVNFVSTSTNTLPTTTYSWNYGDGGSGSGSNSSHTYTATGNYTVTLIATNSLSCSSFSSIPITVSICNLGANFTHTVGANGAVHFSNTSLNTNTLTNYLWKFGDGVYSTAASPSHTYMIAGTYSVTLKIKDTLNSSCNDSLIEFINVTGISCVANSNFTLTPTSTLHYWNATPAYPYNITAANWSWGDGNYTDSLYAFHLYAAPGTYSICLSVTVSCGASSSYCFPYAVYKTNENSSQIVYINVSPPALSTGILNIESEDLSYSIYPNPNNGTFNINLQGAETKNLAVTVLNLVGETIYSSELEQKDGNPTGIIHLENALKGIYFVKVNSGSRTFIQKIIVSD